MSADMVAMTVELDRIEEGGGGEADCLVEEPKSNSRAALS